MDDRLSEVVGQVTRGWMRWGREAARSLGLSMPQLFLLRGLGETGPVPATRWAEMIGSSPSATTSLLDGLEEAGLVQRTHDAIDRRQVLISLTPKGRKMTEQLRTTTCARWREVCAGISRDDLESARSTLKTIADRMGNPEEGRAPLRAAGAPRRSKA